MVDESILKSTKASLGLAPEQTSFDSEILMHLNSAISTLTQVGVGPPDGIYVSGESETWEKLIGTDPRLNAVKSYLHLRVKMLFDPPEIGFVLTAMKEMIKEAEWRLNITVDDEIPSDAPATQPDDPFFDDATLLDGGTP